MKRMTITKVVPILVSVSALVAWAVGQDLAITKRATDDLVKHATARFESSKKGFELKTKLKGRTVEEKFSYSMNGNDVEVLSIQYRNGDLDYEEDYFFQGRQLVYSSEREVFADGGGWSGVYYFKNEILQDFMTNGHGKSEDDNWDPEKEVLRMSRKRIKQLRDHLKRGDVR